MYAAAIIIVLLIVNVWLREDRSRRDRAYWEGKFRKEGKLKEEE